MVIDLHPLRFFFFVWLKRPLGKHTVKHAPTETKAFTSEALFFLSCSNGMSSSKVLKIQIGFVGREQKKRSNPQKKEIPETTKAVRLDDWSV